MLKRAYLGCCEFALDDSVTYAFGLPTCRSSGICPSFHSMWENLPLFLRHHNRSISSFCASLRWQICFMDFREGVHTLINNSWAPWLFWFLGAISACSKAGYNFLNLNRSLILVEIQFHSAGVTIIRWRWFTLSSNFVIIKSLLAFC